MTEIRSTILTPEYIKEFENKVKNLISADTLPNGDYFFNSTIAGDNKNKELIEIINYIWVCISTRECEELRKTTSKIFEELKKNHDNNRGTKENYQRKHEVIDSLIFAQKISIDQKDTANKDIKKQITNLINQHIDQQEIWNVHF